MLRSDPCRLNDRVTGDAHEMIDLLFHFAWREVFITRREREIVCYVRTHVDRFHGLVSKLKNALYAGGHFLVFSLLILGVERWDVSGGRANIGPWR